jgi:hypothetical protein
MKGRHGRSAGTPCHAAQTAIVRSFIGRRDTCGFVRGHCSTNRTVISPSRPRKSTRGQALAVLLPLFAVLVAALWWVLETGEAVAEKQRLRNTADAAALSAAVWQAKVLNFDAYMNRAIVANEAVIAQSVSLRGWSSYVDHLLPRASVVTSAVPYLGAAMLALQRSWSLIDRALQPTLFSAEGVTSALNHDLATAQRVMHASVPFVIPQIVQDVVAANDSRYQVTVGGNWMLARSAVEWADFASFYGGSWRWRQRDVVQRSMDGFSHQRNFTLSLLPGLPFARLEKRAGTDMIGFDTWRAIETLAIHQRRYIFFGRMRETLPIAWAGVENGTRIAVRGIHGGAFSVNRRTATLAERQTRRGTSYLGLPSMWDLSASQRAYFAPPVIIVRLALRDADRRGARSALGFDSVQDLEGEGVRLGASSTLPMSVEAAATATFNRSEPRADGAREAPSLYNPYWRPRLSSTSLVDRLQLAVLDGDPQWLAAVPR